MKKKKYPDLHGACIDNFHKLYDAVIDEQYINEILNNTYENSYLEKTIKSEQ